jgi:hypothetical protein
MGLAQESIPIQAKAWNQRIFDAGLKTRNSDKGSERFVRKFNPEAELDATVAIMQRVHREHGTAVLLTQGSRRCLLLDMTHGLADDEALWGTVISWSEFQPRKKNPRQEPGNLYCPPVFSHVFEKYWQNLENLEEPSLTQACMK